MSSSVTPPASPSSDRPSPDRPFPLARWLRRFVVLLVLAALGAAGWWWLIGRGPLVETARVVRGSAAEIVYATGNVEPKTWAKVSPMVRGRIVERCRCEGRQVKRGDVLARLDDREILAAQTELEARTHFAQSELERARTLSTRGVASGQMVERLESELASLQAQIAAQKERVSNYVIAAPMDGVVLREDGEVGEIVDSTQVLYRVGLPAPLLLIAEVNEEDIPRVVLGQKALLRADAFPGRTLEGTVAEITPAGDPVAKTYRIRIALPDDTPLKVGMSVEANVVVREKDGVLLVPATALAGEAVFVIDGDRLRRRAPHFGIRGTRNVEVIDGLSEGELVVAPASAELADGMRVRVQGPVPQMHPQGAQPQGARP